MRKQKEKKVQIITKSDGEIKVSYLNFTNRSPKGIKIISEEEKVKLAKKRELRRKNKKRRKLSKAIKTNDSVAAITSVDSERVLPPNINTNIPTPVVRKKTLNAGLFICPKCGIKTAKKSNYDKHMHLHSVKKTRNQTIENKLNVKLVNKKKKRNKRPNIRLYDGSRGVIIYERMDCSRCKVLKNITWRYTNSSHGEVYLCKDCKNGAGKIKRKLVKVDAMKRRVSGSFGAGKKR